MTEYPTDVILICEGDTVGMVGRNIRKERNRLGISQQELAKILGISRPAISDIESGTRKVSAEELVKLSKAFSVSIDYLLGLSTEAKVILEKSIKKVKKKPAERINVPQKNIKKFKEVFLYILNKVGAKPNIGETVIYKLLYFIDFDFYEKYEEQLIGATYQKNTYGPTPLEFQSIVKKMEEDEEIEKFQRSYFGYSQKRYLPLRNADLDILTAREIKLIDDVLNRLSDMGGKEISEYSHNDIPWLTTEDDAKIEYEAVFYRTPEYSVRGYEDEDEVSTGEKTS